nr:acetyl-CoA carboxylase carboxyl transferase subunit alpha [Clostridia bacterium]
MTPYERLCEVRSEKRPTAISYINRLITDPIMLYGDRRYGNDPAIIGGIGMLDGIPVTYIATERGNTLEERVRRNFGCPKPEGYRKALRLMKQAEKFHRPVITFIDTSGAYCGRDAEERGQGEAIARNIIEMSGLDTPIISVIIGEAESGGALGIGVADRLYMLRNAVYSVISPEGCASILSGDASKAPEMAEALHITSEDMTALGVADGIIEEHFERFGMMCHEMKQLLRCELSMLLELDTAELKRQRYERFRKL